MCPHCGKYVHPTTISRHTLGLKTAAINPATVQAPAPAPTPAPAPVPLLPPQPGPSTFVQQPLAPRQSGHRVVSAEPTPDFDADSEWEDEPDGGPAASPNPELPTNSRSSSPEWTGVRDPHIMDDTGGERWPFLPRPPVIDINPDDALRDSALLQSSRIREFVAECCYSLTEYNSIKA